MYLVGVLLIAFGVTILIVKNQKDASKGFAVGCIVFPAIFVLLCIIIGIYAINGFNKSVDNSTNADVNNYQIQEEQRLENDAYITLEEFEKLKTGMTYEHCAEIIGVYGKLNSSSGTGEDEFSMYTWEGNSPFSNAVLTFRGNHLYSKTQIGLK